MGFEYTIRRSQFRYPAFFALQGNFQLSQEERACNNLRCPVECVTESKQATSQPIAVASFPWRRWRPDLLTSSVRSRSPSLGPSIRVQYLLMTMQTVRSCFDYRISEDVFILITLRPWARARAFTFTTAILQKYIFSPSHSLIRVHFYYAEWRNWIQNICCLGWERDAG